MTEKTDSLYSVREVARIFGLNESRVRYWAQTGFINPSGSKAGRRLYTFRDLVGIKAAKELLDQGIPLQRVRKSIQVLRDGLPHLDQPLTKLRVCSDGERLVVDQREGTFEPLSGQLLLDFEIDELHHDVAQILELRQREEARPSGLAAGGEVRAAQPSGEPPGELEEPATAYTWFLRACAYDQEDGALDQAIAAYRRALELDPSLAAAHTNLGNLFYLLGRREEARRSYETACMLEPEQAQAHYNLANLYEEEGDLELAVAEYRRALVSDPDFADAHFNLALSLEAIDSEPQAAQHWRRYLDLVAVAEGQDEWRAIARSHLARLERPDSSGQQEEQRVELEPRAKDGQETTSSGSLPER